MSDPRGGRLELFGGPLLRVGDEEVALSPYQTALLAVVGWRVRPVPRSRIIQLLWNDGGEEARRHRLAQLVYSLNRKSGAPVVGTDSARRVVLAQGVESDAVHFRERLVRGEWPGAERMVESGFARLATPVSDSFEDWVEAVRREILDEVRLRVSGAARAAARSLGWETVDECASLLLSLDPTDRQAAHWRVAAAARLEGSPDPPELLRRLVVTARKVERGWTPESETTAFVERWGTSRPRTHRDPGDLPLVGRGPLLARCQEILSRRDSRSSRLLALTGKPGIGKSRILGTLAHEQRLSGRVVLRGRASELARHFPLSTLESALEPEHLGRIDELGTPWRKVLRRFLLRDEEDPGSLSSFRASLGLPIRQLQEAVLVLLDELRAEGPLAVLLDDFQWADASSTVILDHLLRKWSGPSLDLIVAIRSGTDAEFSAGGQMISSLPDHVRRELVEVEELDDADGEELVRTFLSRQGESAAHARIPEILALGGGNPFFLIEIARHGLLHGHLPAPPEAGDGFPPRILDFIQSVVGGLPALERSVLTAAAASQEELTVEDLVRILELSAHELFPAIAHLVEAGLLESAGGSVRVRHDIVRDAVYHRLPAIERTWIHGRLAAALERTSPGNPGRVALHAWKGGRPDLAHTRALEAAEEAEAKGAAPEAMEFLRIALETASSRDEAMEIEIRKANLAYRDRALEAAEPALREAVTRWKGPDGDPRIRSLEARWLDVRELSGDLALERAVEALDRLKAEARSVGDWDSLSEILEITGVMLERRGRIADLPPLLEEAREAAEECDVGGKVRCLRLRAFEGLVGNPEVGREAVLEALELAESDRQKEEWLRTLKRAITLLLYRGEMETELGKILGKKAEDAAADSADWFIQFSFLNALGVAALESMRLDSAELLFNRAKRRIRGTPDSEAEVIIYGNLGELFFWKRDFHTALRFFKRSEAAVNESTPLLFRLMAEAGKGLCCLKTGDLKTANQMKIGISSLPTILSADLTVLFLFEAEKARMRGKKREGASLLCDWAEALRSTFFTTHLKLLAYAEGMYDAAPSLQNLARIAREMARERNLYNWEEILTANDEK